MQICHYKLCLRLTQRENKFCDDFCLKKANLWEKLDYLLDQIDLLKMRMKRVYRKTPKVHNMYGDSQAFIIESFQINNLYYQADVIAGKLYVIEKV